MAATGADDVMPWLYRMEVAHPLPSIDLNRTWATTWLSMTFVERLVAVFRHSYTTIAALYRVGAILSLIIMFVDRRVGLWLTIPSALCGLPALVCTTMFSSTDLNAILWRQYELWFFTVVNTINWSCLASYFGDWRILSLVNGFWGTQLIIFIDANFRTVRSAVRSTLIAIPVLLVGSVAMFFHLLDGHNRVLNLANISLSNVDVFANTAGTLSLFIARKSYGKRQLLYGGDTPSQAIRCVVYRSKLQLKPSGSIPDRRVALPGEASNHPRQQIELVYKLERTVDVRNIMLRGAIKFESAPRSCLWVVYNDILAVGGIALTFLTLTQRSSSNSEHFGIASRVVAVLSVVLAFCHWLGYIVCYHKTLLWWLVWNFDFLFTSAQFTFSMVLLADMLQWDYRALGAVSWWMLFHVVLCLDALTPPVKRHLRFRKVHAFPIVFVTLIAIVALVYGFLFKDVSHIFTSRVLWSFSVENQTVSLNNQSLLVTRLVFVLLWSCRLLWEVGKCPDDEFIFRRGSLEYPSQFEMFPQRRLRSDNKIISASRARGKLRRLLVRSQRQNIAVLPAVNSWEHKRQRIVPGTVLHSRALRRQVRK